MADFKMDGLDDMIKALERLGDGAEETAKKAINEATPLLASSISSSIRSSASAGYATGALANSVKAGEAKINNYGVYAAVTITGKDSSGTRNGEKAAYLEYGTVNQPARPFMRKGVKAAESSVQSTMEQIFEQEIEKYTD